MQYYDAIFYSKNFPALIDAALKAYGDEGKSISGWITKPSLIDPKKVLAYVRLTETERDYWMEVTNLEILAIVTYQGASTADALYKSLFSNKKATKTYDMVYDRKPITFIDEFGELQTASPPERFGQLG